MSSLIVDLLFGLVTAVLGAAAAWWLRRSDVRRSRQETASAKARHAAEVLTRLRDLATRMAIDVGQHSSQVEEINEQLAAMPAREPAKVADVVASLVQANQQMREKLATTEDRLREQAQQIEIHAAEARTDALTLLANRRAFDDELARRFAELRRHGRVFSLIMGDVDHFKSLNDAHGHQAGDEVLRNVGRLLRRKMRETDIAARYGGEEFAIILPGTNLEEACTAAMRAGEAIEKARFHYAGKDLHVTSSWGVAEASSDEREAALVTRADAALYASKQAGRNCVHVHDGQHAPRIVPKKEPAPAAPDAGPASEPVSDPPPQEPTTAEDRPDAEKADKDPARAARCDAVSNLPGRTAFCQQVRSRIAEWKRGGPIFSVLLVEVDQHDRDSQLRDAWMAQAAGRYLTATLREMDVVGRYAAGCFALLLPSVGIVEAIRVAERLREQFPLLHASPDVEQPRLTLSVAAAQVMENDDTIALLTRAEAALDAAERRGGDRAYFHDGERCAPITAMLEIMDYLG